MNRVNKYIVSSLLMLLSLIGSTCAFSITHGPYLINQSERAVTFLWTTDSDGISGVEYGLNGATDKMTESTTAGVMNVGTIQMVRIEGLEPGKTYNYKISSTEVVSYLAYYGKLGQIVSKTGTFTTHDADANSATSYFISDVKNDASLMSTLLSRVDKSAADFVVFGGNCLSNLTNKSTIFSTVIDPASETFADEKPMVYLRGNLEMNGEVAQSLVNYFPTGEKSHYNAFVHGQTLYLALDGAQEKSDDSAVFSGLMRSDLYRESQLKWFKKYLEENSAAIQSTNKTVVFCNRSNFTKDDDWLTFFTEAGVTLYVHGYDANYTYSKPTNDVDFYVLSVGHENVCRVTTENEKIEFEVTDKNGGSIGAITIE